MRLSAKAWNNVIIFSMLLMIFFFNGLHKKLNSEPEQQAIQALLPEQSFILSLAFPELEVERIGRSWRGQTKPSFSSNWQIDETSMQQLINTWQQLELEIAEQSVASLRQLSPLYVASLWLAGEQLAAVFHVYADEQGLLLFDKRSQRVFMLPKATAEQLFPIYDFSQE